MLVVYKKRFAYNVYYWYTEDYIISITKKIMKISRKNIIAVVIVVLVVVGGALWINNSNEGASDYSIVYLTTGEIYIGKLTVFPYLKLEDAYILQVARDENNPENITFQLNPINDALWAPQSLHLVEKNVVFYGILKSDSRVARTIEQQGQ